MIKQLIAGILSVSFAVLFSGCEQLTTKIERENIAGATIHFYDPATVYNVTEWWYEFDISGSTVVACNSNGNTYRATGWTIDEEAATVRVNFGSDWEDYELIPANDGLEEGEFIYSNSNGQPNEGSWERIQESVCSGQAVDGGVTSGGVCYFFTISASDGSSRVDCFDGRSAGQCPTSSNPLSGRYFPGLTCDDVVCSPSPDPHNVPPACRVR